MIHNPEYVKELMGKHLKRTASPVERMRLMAAWDIYDDDELLEMIAAHDTSPQQEAGDHSDANSGTRQMVTDSRRMRRLPPAGIQVVIVVIALLVLFCRRR